MALQINQATTPELTINDIEQTVQSGLEALRNAPLNDQITAALKILTPPGYRIIAQLEEDGRKKRSTAAAWNWDPSTGSILLYFEPLGPTPTPIRAPGASIEPLQSGVTSAGFVTAARMSQIADADLQNADLSEVAPRQIQQCCEALAEAEKAGKAFIALKWFRDNGLMARDYEWTTSVSRRQAVLAKAIEVGAILTSSIPNPRAPQHPTTTVKLNRESQYAQAIAPRFQPIRPKGGLSASEILLRDRGRF